MKTRDAFSTTCPVCGSPKFKLLGTRPTESWELIPEQQVPLMNIRRQSVREFACGGCRHRWEEAVERHR